MRVAVDRKSPSPSGFGPDGFHQAGDYALRLLATLEVIGIVSKEAIILGTCLGLRSSNGGAVRVRTQDVAKIRGTSVKAARQTLAALAEWGFVVPLQTRDTYLINPALFHRGSLAGHAESMRNFRRWWQEKDKFWEEHPAWKLL